MLNIILACIAGALLVACIAVAMTRERKRREVTERLEPRVDYSRFDQDALLRNRSERAQDWTTWESDLSTDIEELYGYESQLVATIEPRGSDWVLRDSKGKEVAIRKHKEDVMRLANQMVPVPPMD